MLTNNGYYRQTDGLAMGSPLAPLLANGWLSKFDEKMKGEGRMYFRYMEDILRDIKCQCIEGVLHPSLKFTCEREKDGTIPFLDMLICHSNRYLTSTWYTKSTDTGLPMKYLALAPLKYKRSIVSDLVHRIYRACSPWEEFYYSLVNARKLLLRNQYTPSFFEPIITRAVYKLLIGPENWIKKM